MTARTAFVLLTLALAAGSACAEPPPSADDVSKAYYKALEELRSGEDRQGIADRLKPVVEKNTVSWYLKFAGPLVVDLVASAKNPPGMADDLPEERLADTAVPFYLLKYAENWGSALKRFAEKEPRDPVSQLVNADRAIITKLISLLDDRSPARCDDSVMTTLDWNRPQARVCDLALALIEYHGKVRFYHDTTQSTYLNQLPNDKRAKVADDVAAWWEKVQDKPVAFGIRAQLEHGQSYPERVWMAKTLAQLTEGQKTDDREFALSFLQEIVKQNPPHPVGLHAAQALAELGDTSAVDIYYQECKSWLEHSGRHQDSSVTFYLCKHGGRREWELLHALSLSEIRERKQLGTGVVWACVLNSEAASTNPYAIPILGLTLGQRESADSRVAKDGGQPFSYAEKACELLQKQAGKEFRYQRQGNSAARLNAVKQAQVWWDSEGKAKYTFDSIEKELASGNDPPS